RGRPDPRRRVRRAAPRQRLRRPRRPRDAPGLPRLAGPGRARDPAPGRADPTPARNPVIRRGWITDGTRMHSRIQTILARAPAVAASLPRVEGGARFTRAGS